MCVCSVPVVNILFCWGSSLGSCSTAGRAGGICSYRQSSKARPGLSHLQPVSCVWVAGRTRGACTAPDTGLAKTLALQRGINHSLYCPCNGDAVILLGQHAKQSSRKSHIWEQRWRENFSLRVLTRLAGETPKMRRCCVDVRSEGRRGECTLGGQAETNPGGDRVGGDSAWTPLAPVLLRTSLSSPLHLECRGQWGEQGPPGLLHLHNLHCG
jgi:hypothetical protein